MKPSSYFAVIFSSQRSDVDAEEYERMAERMLELAKNQKGFLGVESARDQNGFGITVSYWSTAEDIKAWKSNNEHQVAQEFGRAKWYSFFKTRICKVEREYEFGDALG